MKIDSALITFHSDSQKNSSSALLREQHSERLQADSSNARTFSSDLSVDLSYAAVMQASHNSSSQSTSIVTRGDETTTHQRNTNLSSLVSSVIGKEAHINKSTTFSLADDLRNTFSLAEQQYLGVAALQNDMDIQLEVEAINGAMSQVDIISVDMAQQTRVDIHASHIYQEEEQMRFESQGMLTTEDGRTINFMLELDMAREFELVETLDIERTERQLIDPLVINLQGGSAQLTNTSFSFDLNADGTEEEISFVSGGSGFLALDANNDGKINDGSELFGTQGLNGFADLARHDSDGNHWIDENDEIFNELKVWTRDSEGNDQLTSLKDAGVGAIYLGSSASTFDLTDSENNLLGSIKRSGVFLSEDGQVASIQELDLTIHGQQPGAQALDAEYQDTLAAAEQAELPPVIIRTGPAAADGNSSSNTPDTLDATTNNPKTTVVEHSIQLQQSTVQDSKNSSSALSKEEAETEAIAAFNRTFNFNDQRLDLFERLNIKTDQLNAQQESSLSIMRQTIEHMRKAQQAEHAENANTNPAQQSSLSPHQTTANKLSTPESEFSA